MSRYRYPSPKRIRRQITSRAQGLVWSPLKTGNVLVLHTGRSGSTVLGNMLDQNPGLFWDGEVVERQFHQLAHKRGTGVGEQFGAKSLADAVAQVRKRKRQMAGGRIYGFELQQYQLEMLNTTLAQAIERFSKAGFDRFVILNRRNHLRKIVSHMVATTHRRHHAQGISLRKAPSVRLDPGRCFVDHRPRKLLERIRSYDAFFRQARRALASRKVLELDYDTHISANPQDAYGKVCDFLGIDPVPVEVTLSKTANFPLRDLVENYEEVAEELNDTEYGWMAPLPDASKP